ncbi:hypothetical protein [uncultured Rikenella sp.]|nr:hypothetical protein [uncultured Rikenella sp.]
MSIGNRGYSWSATITTHYSHLLYFYMSLASPSNSHSRAYGLQLRCLSE